MRWSKVLVAALLPVLVHSLASTDSIQDVDPPQSGYLPNHNMDPNVITGGKFAVSWTSTYNTNEVLYAKPLVYTPPGYTSELVITVSNENIVRIHNGLTGAIIITRTLDPPFQSVDSDCGDIPNTVGITGTPIIDPTTSIMYFFSKGYKNAVVGPAGTINGQYKFYAVNIPSLTDVSGFPVIIEGSVANNDATRYFVGGTVLQRPSLASIGNSIVAGFGGHCDNFNYTGMLLSVSKTSGVGVTNVIAMEAQPGAPSPQALDITIQNGGKAGIWQSGMGIAADTNRVFFATGNGRGAGDNGDAIPASGMKPISTLEQVVANFAVNPSTGVLTQSDYFEPYEYDSLNGGDRDFGSSGVALLDPGTFSGGGVTRVAMAGGKSGKVYVLNANNLGGYAQGPGNQDLVIQTIVNANPLFSGIGSYPLEGGYIYFNPVGDLLYCYKMGTSSNGQPFFTLAGKSAATFAGKSVPTITTLNGQAGTGIVWLADTNVGVVAFHAVPVNGVLQPITIPATGGLVKNARPAFGNGRIYVDRYSVLYALGAPTTAASGSSPPSTPIPSTTSSSTSSSTKSSSTTSSSSTTLTTSSTSTTSTTTTSKPSTTSTTSTTTTSKPSTTSTTSSAVVTTPSSTTSVTSVTTPVVPPSTGYQYIGCFQDTSVGRSLPLLFANDSMTPELCGAYVQSLANQPTPTVLPYYYVEYHDECYGGSVFNFGTSQVSSLTGSNACTDICSGSIGAATTGTAKCGGPYQFNLYAQGGVATFPGTTVYASTTSTPSSPSSNTVKTTTTSSSTTLATSTTAAKTTTSSTSASTTSTTVVATPAPSGYQYIGCFQDTAVGHALPLLFANDSMTPELCAAYVKSLASQPTPTVLPYYYLEYHRECYGGSVFNFGGTPVTSLSGANACTDVCAGSVGAAATGTAKCGGPFQFNLYATNGVVSFPGLPATTYSASYSTASSTTTSATTSTSSAPAGTTAGSTVTYNWNIDWVSAAPDGFSRPFVGINGQWPCPPINVNVGETVIINVQNSLANESTAIHFHGLHQRGTNQMDGPAMVTQCGIPPGASFTYQFQINQTGTYWYHAHIGGQITDGLRGPLIVHDPAAPYQSQINQEIVMTLSDLYHQQAPYLINFYQSPMNENLNQGAEPVPNATLINEAQNVQFNIVPGQTYLFRIINMGVYAAQWLQFDQHEMTIVEIDGVYTQPYTVSQLFIPVAQRYSVIVTAKTNKNLNYAIVSSMSTDMFNPIVTPANLNQNVTAWLVYDPTKPLPAPFSMQLMPFDDTAFFPYDKQPLIGGVNNSISLNAAFGPNDQNQQRAQFNGISYTPQKVPSLYTALSAPASLVNNPNIYGVNSNAIVLGYGDVVELTVSNNDYNSHPFHLHGHQFQVVDRSGGGLLFPPIAAADPPTPMRRDVVQVYGNGYVTIRFIANNPGISLFHCHIEWHVEAGLTATFIEAPTQLQESGLILPANHLSACKSQGIPTQGNAAGNTANYLDLTGANTDPPLQAWGALVNPPS